MIFHFKFMIFHFKSMIFHFKFMIFFFQAMLVLPGPLSGWEVALDFSSPISKIESPMAEVKTQFVFLFFSHDNDLHLRWQGRDSLGP